MTEDELKAIREGRSVAKEAFEKFDACIKRGYHSMELLESVSTAQCQDCGYVMTLISE